MASTLSIIEADVKTFFTDLETSAGKFCKAFVQIFKKAPSALQTAENFVNEAAPLIEAGVALADPVAEPLAAAALATVETGLAGLQASAAAADSGQSFLTSLQAFAATVPATLTSIDVKNPALKAKITAIVTFVTNEAKVLLPAVTSWVKQIAGQGEQQSAQSVNQGTSGN